MNSVTLDVLYQIKKKRRDDEQVMAKMMYMDDFPKDYRGPPLWYLLQRTKVYESIEAFLSEEKLDAEKS